MSGAPPPLERTKCPPKNQQELSLAYITAASRTQHTGGFTPCTDGLHDGPGTDTIPPSPHHLEFTEKPCNVMYAQKVTVHV